MNKEEKIISILKSVKRQSLSPEDKAQLKFDLMDVIKSGSARTSIQNAPYNLNHRRFAMPFIPVLIAVLFVGASGTAVVANDAKPGDPLFKFDQIVEKLETKLVFDEEAKVKLMTSLSQERIDELEAFEGAKVSSNADAQAKFEAHKADAIARVAASIEKLNQLESKFQARLDGETDPKARTRLEKILAHLQLVEQRREALIDKIEAREFGSANAKIDLETKTKVDSSELKINLRDRLKISDDAKLRIKDELRSEFRFKFDDDDDDSEIKLESSNSGSGSLNSGSDDD